VIPRQRPAAILRWAVLALGVGMLALFAYTTALRLAHPFALEWMEAGSYDMLAHVLQGGRIYERPSTEYIAFNYTPLYYLVSAATARAVGPGFVALRLVSLLAAYGTMLIVFAIVRRAGAARLPALVAALTFVGTYEVTAGSMDVARPDALYVLFLTGGLLALLQRDEPRRMALLSGTLFALAYLTKQSAIPSLALLFLYLLARRTRVALLVLAGFAITSAVAIAWFMRVTDGWYAYYTLQIATGHKLGLGNIANFAKASLAPMAVAILFGAGWLGWPARARTRRDATLVAALASATLGCFWLSLYPGTSANAAIPAMVACAILLGVGLDSTLTWAARWPPVDAAKLATVAWLAVALQWVGFLYAPAAYAPGPGDAAAGRALVERIAATPGEVLISNHSYLSRLAGKGGQAHGLALSNALQGDPRGPARQVSDEVDSAIAQRRYALLVLDADGWAARDSIPGYGAPLEFFHGTRHGTPTWQMLRHRIAPPPGGSAAAGEPRGE
jgi:4-amino-4-deoxy-L-arabinose transferase-like glycosyltransferase